MKHKISQLKFEVVNKKNRTVSKFVPYNDVTGYLRTGYGLSGVAMDSGFHKVSLDEADMALLEQTKAS